MESADNSIDGYRQNRPMLLELQLSIIATSSGSAASGCRSCVFTFTMKNVRQLLSIGSQSVGVICSSCPNMALSYGRPSVS